MSQSGLNQATKLSRKTGNEAPEYSKSRNHALIARIRILLVGLFIFGLSIFFLPTILVVSPLKQTVIDYALTDLNGSAEIGGISVGWFSPVRIHNISVRDSQGVEFLTVDSICSTRSLVGLMFANGPGQIEVDQPAIDLRIRENGSNLEDALSAYLSPDADGPPSIPELKITITNGIARWTSDSIGEVHVLSGVNCTIQTLADIAPLVISFDANSQAHDKPIGQASLQLVVDSGQPVLEGNTIDSQIQLQDFPVDVLAPLLTRYFGTTDCKGQLDGKFRLSANFQNSSATLSVEGIRGRQLAIVSPGWFGADQFSMSDFSADGDVQIAPGTVIADEFKVESDIARIQANGHFDIGQLAKLADGQEIPHSDFQLDGTIDLAGIINMLPESTRLRNEVRLNSGILQIQASSRNENGEPRLVVNADAANLNFAVSGRNINWQQPVRFVGVAQRHNGSMRFDNMQLQSEFLTASGQAGWEQGRFQIAGDLQRAVNQLGQVLDLGGLKLAGIVSGTFGWQAAEPLTQPGSATGTAAPIRFTGKFRLENPAFQYPGIDLWKASQLDLAIAGDADVSSNGTAAIEAARIDVVVGDERASGVLHERIENLFSNRKFQFQCEATGSIARWISHARIFGNFPAFFADGRLASQFLMTLNPKSCRLNQIRMEAADFVFNGFGLDIREPSLDGKMNIKYVYGDGSVAFTKATLACSSVAASTEQLKFDLAEKILADGNVAFRANVNRASNWFGYSMPGDSIRWDGSVVGAMKFSSEPGMFGGDLDTEISDFILVQPIIESPAQPVLQQVSSQRSFKEFWRESSVKLSSSIYLREDFNHVQLRGLDLKSESANLEGHGSIDDLATAMIVDLSGRWNVNWDKFNQLARELTGEAVVFEEAGWRPFEIKGPIFDPGQSANSTATAWFSPQLTAVAAVAWKQATVFGIPLGKSQIDVRMKDSIARLSSASNQSIVDQWMALQPYLDLRQSQPFLKIGAGTLLDHWQIAESDSRTWLKYAAPLLADATSAAGQLSFDLTEASIPLYAPVNATARGTLHVHELTVGAGPLAKQLLPLIDQVRSILKLSGASLQTKTDWLQLKPQSLPIVIDQGRVYHDTFEFNYGELRIRTRGSVGFDQTLNIVAEIPILEKWVAGDKVLTHLIGKSISIPIGGTLSQPMIDPRGVSQLTQQLVKDSALGLIDDTVAREVGKVQKKVGSAVQDEIRQLQDHVNRNVNEKLQNGLKNGLQDLFGGGGKNQN